MIFSRERLFRLLEVLGRQGGSETIRNLQRTYSIYRWEVDAAEILGWVKIEVLRPKTGRPSRVVRKLSTSLAAKLPETRQQIGSSISIRHFMFALRATNEAIKGGLPSIGICSFVDAYQQTFQGARSRTGAHASASRLLNHPNVIAAMQWNYARKDGLIPTGEPMPSTARQIWKRLRELGSWRISWEPFV